MVNVNLLAWREQARTRQHRHVLVVVGIAVALLLLITLCCHLVINAKMNNQLTRNAYLRTEMSKLSRQLSPVRANAKKFVQYDKRYVQWRSLQNNRFDVVNVLNELPKVIPNGVSLHEVNVNGSEILLQGEARSHYKVADMMNRIEQSALFSAPKLTEIALSASSNKKVVKSKQMHAFILTLHEEKMVQKKSGKQGSKG